MIQLTPNAKNAAAKITLTPTIVFKITKYNKIFGSAGISEYVRIGDPGLLIGIDWVIGGVRLIQGQSPYISYTAGGGTTASIGQKISPDRKQSTSVTSMVVSLLDKNEEISRLISPGFELAEVLGEECEVLIGFIETAFPEDYNVVFRGLISDIESGAGYVNFMLASSEEKKRRPLVNKNTSELDGAITDVSTSDIAVIDGSIFTGPVNGPNGSPDTSIERLARIEDEIINYQTVNGDVLETITRGYLGTVAAAHDDDKEIQPGVRLQGNGIDLALKIMLSGWNDYYATDVDIKHINAINIANPVSGAIYFDQVNVETEYGITAGDYITVSGATNGANNITLEQIADVQVTDDGSFVIIDGASFVIELDTPGTASFRSKYDTLGIGLKMKPSEVDVAQHEFIKDFFLSNFEYDFALFDVPITKDFLDQEIYLPMACFAVPRQGRASVTYTIGPIGNNFIPLLNTDNVKNAPALKLKRSIASNFSNQVQYEYDYDVIESKYLKVKTFASAESKTRIPIGDKTILIKSQGIKTGLNASQITTLASERLLNRYRYGAEFINGIQLLYGEGYPIEIGDIVLVDYKSLQMTDFNTGDRSGGFKYMEVINKTLNNKTGDVSIDIVNTSFELTDRYGVISPSSKIGTGATNVKLPLKKSYGTKLFQREIYKWEDYIGETVLVHSPDFTQSEESTISALGSDPDAMLVDPPLSFVPGENYIVDAPNYPTSTDENINRTWKGMHAYFSPNVAVTNSISDTEFEVDVADIGKFRVGAIVRINNFDYSDYSPEAEVISVDTGTNVVEIDQSAGFTIDTTHEVKLIGFADGGYSYRLI